jgi:predicted enzyme related to lactoylglutathione lyase
MSERNGYQAGVPCWVTTVQPDPDRAAAFYGSLLDWETEDLMGPDHPASYYMCRRNGGKVAGIVPEHGAPAPPRPAWTTHVWVENVDETARRARELGGSVVGEPFESPAGGRMAVLADPAGAVFCAWQPGTHRGAERVNEPGAWAMSMLHTGEPEAAAAFYGELFGWTTEAFGPATLFRLPGYVGGEPDQPVSREVIAAMVQDKDSPPYWSVDFWVDDTDGTAAKAEQLQGRVVVAPHDTPGFRTAVLADPDGAVFSINQLVR